MQKVSESEKRRLLSLKEKKRAFKAKEQLLRIALNETDNTNRNNKIIFDDAIEQEVSLTKSKKSFKPLFDDENDEEVTINIKDFKEKKNYDKFLPNLGFDSRFTLDERFHDNSSKELRTNEKDEPCDLSKENISNDLKNEKEWQLDILEGVLGTPIVTQQEKNQNNIKQFRMIRYDPTENKCQKYEITTDNHEPQTINNKKKRKVKINSEIDENTPIEVSKDVYYTISNTFTTNSNQESFSLLNKYGRKTCNTENTNSLNDVKHLETNEHSFDPNNVFKCDLSNINTPEFDYEKPMINSKNENNIFFGRSDTFFFSENDNRFNEAIEFFKIRPMSNNEFHNLRNELKKIVRMKIRNNTRKLQLRGKKKNINKRL